MNKKCSKEMRNYNENILNGITLESITTEVITYISTRVAPVLLRNSSYIGLAKSIANVSMKMLCPSMRPVSSGSQCRPGLGGLQITPACEKTH